VLVTHRLESVTACDQVVVMEAGRIVERGTYHELLNRNGHFARMLSAGPIQSGRRETVEVHRSITHQLQDARQGSV
jgi:ABC-type transport system involved in cytochrome bd biosynthesis fused ATPase/permease subunit